MNIIEDFEKWWGGHSRFRTLMFAVIITNIILGAIIYFSTAGSDTHYYMLWTSPNILLNYSITIIAAILIAYVSDRTHGNLNYVSAFAQGAFTFLLASYITYYMVGGKASLDLISTIHYIPFYLDSATTILGYSFIQGGVFYGLVYEFLVMIGKL